MRPLRPALTPHGQQCRIYAAHLGFISAGVGNPTVRNAMP